MDFHPAIKVQSGAVITHEALWRGVWGVLSLSGTKEALVSARFIRTDPETLRTEPLPAPWGTTPGRLTILLGGTEFQRSVWRALATLCQGERISYRELAHRVGRPRAIRAVASAVAANPLPVILPCHRVIRADGVIGDYQGGSECKHRLLRAETPGVTA